MEYTQIGSVVKPHGIKGDLVIYSKTDAPFRKDQLPTLYIGNESAKKEFKPVSVRIKDKLITLHFEGIDDRNTAELYIKKKVYIDSESLNAMDDKAFFTDEIKGFEITDLTEGRLGEIKTVYELPQHPVFAIDYNGKEVLIPATPDFIIKIDRKKKIIEMDLPAGLLDIYIT